MITRKQRERELRRRKALRLWGENLTRAQIARFLGVSERTVVRDLQYWLVQAGYSNLVKAYISVFVPDDFEILKILNDQIRQMTAGLKKNR